MLQQELKEGSQITLKGTRQDGSTYEFPLNHTYNNNQVCHRPSLVLSPHYHGLIEHAAMHHGLIYLVMRSERRMTAGNSSTRCVMHVASCFR